jgi:hypothetical protein
MQPRSKSTKKKGKSKTRFITKTIKVNTPYVTDGYIQKKYLNPAYLKETAALADPRREKAWTGEDLSVPFLKPLLSPYEAAVSCSPKRNMFPHVKSKYMADVHSQLSRHVSSQGSYVVRCDDIV